MASVRRKRSILESVWSPGSLRRAMISRRAPRRAPEGGRHRHAPSAPRWPTMRPGGTVRGNRRTAGHPKGVGHRRAPTAPRLPTMRNGGTVRTALPHRRAPEGGRHCAAPTAPRRLTMRNGGTGVLRQRRVGAQPALTAGQCAQCLHLGPAHQPRPGNVAVGSPWRKRTSTARY